MPRGDGTGPWGLGPMTGRAMGLCAGYPAPGYANQPGRRFGLGRGGWGRGRGFGRGRGWGRGFYPPYMPAYGYPGYAPYYSQPTAQEELQMLKDEADALKSEMEAIETRMKELEKEKK